jgi:hypothetical protein
MERWQYDAEGNPTRIARSYEGEGSPEVKTNQFDDHDNLIHSEWTDNKDGIPTRAITYQWEATGWGHIFAMSPPAPPNEVEEYEWPQ